MSNPKMKTESYQQFGGINSHWSPYNLSPLEFLDIQNFDFQIIGSLQQRWGSTQYVGQTCPGPINSLFEFSQLNGASQVLFSYSGGIFAGATTGQSQGLSLTVVGATQQMWGVVPITVVRTPFPSGVNAFAFLGNGAYYLGETTLSVYGSGARGITFILNPAASQSDNTIDYAVLDNFLFMADGNKFLKYDGVTTYPVGLPPILWATNGPASLAGSQNLGFGAIINGSTALDQNGFQFGPSFGIYYLWASYVNNRGFEGPVWPLMNIYADTQYNASVAITPAFTSGGVTGLLTMTLTLATPQAYGISAINIYSFYDPYNASIGQTYVSFVGVSAVNSPFFKNVASRFWDLGPPYLMQTVAASGSTATTFQLGPGVGTKQPLLQSNSIGEIEPITPNTYSPLGLTLIGPGGALNFDANAYQSGLIQGYFPRYIETYQNRLFLAGFSTTPSTVWFSDLAEPEGYAPDFNFEVRTNDADVVTGMKAYATRLYIFKQHSFHVLSGDNPNNFVLQEVSGQYGCLNNRSSVVFNDILVFLDQKGVMMYNGSGLSVLSEKVQSYFDQMNYNVALNTAIMEHDKLRNQVVVAIPINGSSTNNITLVYDYILNAWTTYKGFTPSVFTTIQGRNVTKNLFFGDTSGRVNWFGSSFMADNGAGITTYFKSRFLHDLGESFQKQFRRLYVNATPPGVTLNMPINFYQDYGSSVVYSTTFQLGAFQNRIDYGISAKSLAFDLSSVSSVTLAPLALHGFTIESRLQRRV